jgi:hypothetical protein
MMHTKNKNLFYLILLVFLISCQGEEGAIGPVGEDGTDGLTSLTFITTEAPGINCENGGVKIDVGIDNNTNGTLDTDEIQSTSYVCNGLDGQVSLTSVTTEPAGANCTIGGLRIDSGLDINSNGALEANEVTATAYVCNGIDGNNSLTKITNEVAGTNCENGGLKIDSGIDTNGDGTLDDTEISATAYVCNGNDGNNNLTKITNEAAGTNCENGGLKIDAGVDEDGNGTLDDSEIIATAYTCNGTDGLVSLVNISDEVSGGNCTSGGIKIESGLDSNDDGVLSSEEIQITRFVCNGEVGSELRIGFNLSGTSSFSTTSNLIINTDGRFVIPNFNLDNYVGADSVAIGAMLSTANTATNCSLELYDVTNNAAISNSLISTNNTSETWVYSSTNFIADLPSGSVNLGLRLSSDNGASVTVRNPRIFIFWK